MTDQNHDHLDDPDFDLEALQEAISVLTGKPFDPATLTGHLLIAYRRLIVRSIRSPYEPQTEMEDTFEEMRVAAPLLRMAKTPQPAVRILATSFTGKSVGARDYVRRVKGQLGESSSSVVYVKLDSDGSVASLAQDILRALGEARPEGLSAEKRWPRARRALKDHKVDLLILDEFQRAGRRLTIHPVIAMKILDILDESDCAIAFVGKLTAKQIFKATEDLGNRLDTPVSIGRLSWTVHKEQFIAFADAFDQALVDTKVIKLKAGLADPEIAQLLLESASGAIGQFSRIIESAVINITRNGHDCITRQDLSDAVQDWAVGNQRITYNPFTVKKADTGTKKDNGKPAAKRTQDPLDSGSDDLRSSSTDGEPYKDPDDYDDDDLSGETGASGDD